MKKYFIIHPLLFGLYPVIQLYAYNIGKTPMPVYQIFKPIVIIIFFVFAIWSLCTLILKNIEKGALLTTILFFLFFSFRHFYNIIGIFGRNLGFQIDYRLNLLIILFLYIFTFSTITYFIIKIQASKDKFFTKFLTFIGLTLVIISTGSMFINISKNKTENQHQESIKILSSEPDAKKRPDIYYIILDGYSRADILSEVLEYDNTEFLEYLSKKGFYIAQKSKANYYKTALSLRSSLNLNYLDKLEENNTIHNNLAAEILKKHGYTFITFSTGFNETEIRNADIYIKCTEFNEFDSKLISLTPLNEITNVLYKQNIIPLKYNFYQIFKSQQYLNIFDKFSDIKKFKSPIFVFAHLQGVHEPFIFDESGEEKVYSYYKARKNPSLYKEGYREQLTFLNKKLKVLIKNILDNSKTPPVIILQGDHGIIPFKKHNLPIKEQRLAIFNVYYLPDNGSKKLYKDITPVNTFRTIFNYYLKTELPILPDKSYFPEKKCETLQ